VQQQGVQDQGAQQQGVQQQGVQAAGGAAAPIYTLISSVVFAHSTRQTNLHAHLDSLSYLKRVLPQSMGFPNEFVVCRCSASPATKTGTMAMPNVYGRQLHVSHGAFNNTCTAFEGLSRTDWSHTYTQTCYNACKYPASSVW
jgi:hypothetical protein